MEYSAVFGHLLLTTDNKSEVSAGYATLYGDTNGGLGLIGDIFKTEVFGLCRHINTTAGHELIPAAVIDRGPRGAAEHLGRPGTLQTRARHDCGQRVQAPPSPNRDPRAGQGIWQWSAKCPPLQCIATEPLPFKPPTQQKYGGLPCVNPPSHPHTAL
jgi:hypothetical protein